MTMWIINFIAAEISLFLCGRAFYHGHYALAVAYGILGGICTGIMMATM